MKKWFLFLGCVFSLASFSQDIDVLHYRYEFELNNNNDSLLGIATVRFIQNAPNHKATFDLADINKDGKGMKVVVVLLGHDKLSFVHENGKLAINLPQIKVGDTSTVWIGYKGIPSDGLIISKNKYGDKTFFADNWPNRAHNWIPCNDVPNDKASFEFIVTAPSQYKVISNGEKIEEKDLGNGQTKTHWKEDTPLPTKVMVIGVAKFAVKTFEDSPPNVPVSAWVFQQDSTKGFHDYSPAPEILQFFSNYIAPYPYEKLANVQSKTIFGGMENASAIFYFENSVTGNGGIEDLLAHEIAHQWFGDMATEKSFAHLWLSEGFATYFTDIYWQHKYGDEAFQKRLQKEREQVITFTKTNNHPVVDTTQNLMSLLNANSYQKGAWVLHMLRAEVGDSVFHQVIQAYYQQYKGSNADTRDFEAVAEKVSGKKLKWFFDQWLYQPGIPQLQIEQNFGKDEVKLKIIQQGTKFKFPLEVSLVKADGSSVKKTIDVNDQMVDFKTKISGVKAIIIDPDYKLLYTEIKK